MVGWTHQGHQERPELIVALDLEVRLSLKDDPPFNCLLSLKKGVLPNVGVGGSLVYFSS